MKKAIVAPHCLFETNPEGILDREKVFEWQSDVIRKLAEAGPCIIVGRCADEVLKDHENLISLFVTAPFAVREERIKELYPNVQKEKYMTYGQYVNQTDRLRAYYYNYHTGRDWGNMNNYDLILDSSKLGIEKTAGLIAEYVKARTE